MKRVKILSQIILLGLAILSFASCQKDEVSVPSVTFTQQFGTADNKGEYLLTGLIVSKVPLEKVVLTKEGTVSPNLTIAGYPNTYTDNSTAKNKTEYNFSYLIAGVAADTYIAIDIYDRNGTKKSTRFLVKAYSN